MVDETTATPLDYTNITHFNVAVFTCDARCEIGEVIRR